MSCTQAGLPRCCLHLDESTALPQCSKHIRQEEHSASRIQMWQHGENGIAADPSITRGPSLCIYAGIECEECTLELGSGRRGLCPSTCRHKNSPSNDIPMFSGIYPKKLPAVAHRTYLPGDSYVVPFWAVY